MAIELTKAQRDCVEYSAGDLLVKGVPGAGKSVVLMQRALRFNQKAIEEHVQKRILILSYTTSLVRYTRELVDLTGVVPCMIEIETIDKVCLKLYRSMTKKSYVQIVSDARERNDIVSRAVQQHFDKTKKKHRFHDVDIEFWSDEFLWIKQKNICTERQYIDAERIGRGGKIRMTREDKAVAYALFTEYCSIMTKENKLDWEDLYSYIIAHESAIPESAKFDYVLVDEAQDLSYVKLKVAKLLTKRTLTIAADKAQKIYKTSFSWKELGIDIRGRASRSLEKTFRSSKQIVQLAESLLEVNKAMQDDQSEYTDPVFPEREGPIPTIISCANAGAEKDIVVELLRKHIGNKRIIGLLYRSRMEGQQIQRWLLEAGIQYEEVKKDTGWSLNIPGVKMTTMHSSKGLEFDVVLIPRFNAAGFPPERLLIDADEAQINELLAQERSLLYVGMTRAKYELYLTYAGMASRYLEDLAPEHYVLITDKGEPIEKPERKFVPRVHEGPKPAYEPAQSEKKWWKNIGKRSESTVKNVVQNGSTVQTHVLGGSDKKQFTIDTDKYWNQTVFIGKKVGETVKLFNQELVIESIE